MSFWDIVWFIVLSFVFVAYLMMLFSIVGDLFRDRDLSGWAKAAWMIALVFLPFLTAIVYLIARGDGMVDREAQVRRRARAQEDAYVRSVVAETTPAGEISTAKSMLDSGTITAAEFDVIKQRALAG